MNKNTKKLLIFAGVAVVAYYAYTQWQKNKSSENVGFIKSY